MTQIADAPWIREAEMYGMPPYEEEELPKSDIIDDMSIADDFISKAVDSLCRAAKSADGFRVCEDHLNSLIMSLEDFQCDMREERTKIERGERD